jgi:hypothetical protein
LLIELFVSEKELAMRDSVIWGRRHLTVGQVFGLFLFVLLTIKPGPLQAEEKEQQIVKGMNQIANNWKAAIQNGTLFLRDCSDGTRRASRLSLDTRVSFDVKRTDSLVTPYIGTITLTGSVETNYPCGRDDEALANTNFSANPYDPREYIAYYGFDGRGFTISGGNEVFQNAILSAMTAPAPHNKEVLSKFGLLGLVVN